jgi:hypothetical protein
LRRLSNTWAAGKEKNRMAKHHRHHHRHHRRNPFGIQTGTLRDAVYVAAGAVGASALPGMIAPTFSVGWTGVAATGVAAVGVSFLARMFGGEAGASEALKGGLAAMVIRALHQAGIGKNLGLGLYAPSWFGIPTASSQYLQAAAANTPGFNRGGGTIVFPGPSGAPVVAAAPPQGRLGYHRFRSRYAGSYG